MNYPFNENETISVNHVANDDLSAKELRLYTSQNVDTRWGTAVIVTGNEMKFDDPGMVVQSLLFTGNHYWTLYFGKDCTGKAICLEPAKMVQQSQIGVTYEKRTNYGQFLRCVKSGCE